MASGKPVEIVQRLMPHPVLRNIFFNKLNMKIVHRVYFTVLKLFDLLKYCWCCNIAPFQLETYWIEIISKAFTNQKETFPDLSEATDEKVSTLW